MSTAIEVRVGSLVMGLASSLCAELTVANEEAGVPKPTMCTVLPGSSVSYDYCDVGGMAYARLVGIQPVSLVPGKCATEFDITVELGILRCAPIMQVEGDEVVLPSDAEQLAASMQQFFDMGLMHKVLTCSPVAPSFDFWVLGTYTPVGPDGGCVGGLWSATWRTA